MEIRPGNKSISKESTSQQVDKSTGRQEWKKKKGVTSRQHNTESNEQEKRTIHRLLFVLIFIRYA